MSKLDTEVITCPLCNEIKSKKWAEENGFTAVRCANCQLIYVNPRPIAALIDEAVKTGIHSNVEHGRSVITRRISSKVTRYKRLLSSIFPDVWKNSSSTSWLDVGAGYGELMEAVSLLCSDDSKIDGIEPMKPKADSARARGLNVREVYLNEVNEKYDFISIINIFSHIPDFKVFLEDLKMTLNPGGELLIETGNTADMEDSSRIPKELNLPDHLVFAGESQISSFLENAGFSVVSVKRLRTDGFINFGKDFIKKCMGRNVNLSIPYTSQYRTVLFRAKLEHVVTPVASSKLEKN